MIKADQLLVDASVKIIIISFRGEGVIDGPGLAEMVRMLSADNLIPKREPWENFVDPSFLPAK